MQSLGYRLIGDSHAAKSDWVTAMEDYFKSLKLAEEIKDTAKMAYAKYKIAYQYMNLKNDSLNRKYLLESSDLYERIKDFRMLAEAYNMLGTSYKDGNDYERALDYHHRSLKIKEKQGDKKGVAYSLNNIALVYKKKQEYNKALVYLKRSLEIKNELRDGKGIAGSNINIASVYTLKNDFQGAVPYLEKGIRMADSVKATEFLLVGLRNAADCYYKLKEYKKTADYYNRYAVISDSLYKAVNTKQIAEMQAKYETEKKQKEIELQAAKLNSQESDLQRQKILNYAIIGGLLLAFLLIAAVYRGYRQNKKANEILAEKNMLIEEKNKDITDSIRYAQRLQQAILPPEERLKDSFPDSFIFYKPKDIVSGDFYFFEKTANRTIIAAVDCTGHGVPGAFMSIVAHNLFYKAVAEKNITEPAAILNFVNDHLAATINRQPNDEIHDGMDVALCSFNMKEMSVEFAGAFNPLLLFRNGNLTEIKANRFPVGMHAGESRKFSNKKITLEKGDCLYIFSDGYADQLGSDKGKKMMTKNFKQLLSSFAHLVMSEQKAELADKLNRWQGKFEQVDDILVIGIRV